MCHPRGYKQGEKGYAPTSGELGDVGDGARHHCHMCVYTCSVDSAKCSGCMIYGLSAMAANIVDKLLYTNSDSDSEVDHQFSSKQDMLHTDCYVSLIIDAAATMWHTVVASCCSNILAE